MNKPLLPPTTHASQATPMSKAGMLNESGMTVPKDIPLHIHMQYAIENYLDNLNGETPTQMYELFLHQMEKPLLEAVLRYTRGNQSKTALMLGLNRGTLRTKLKIHNLL